MQLSHGAATDTGRKRSENQDSLLVDFDQVRYPADPALFVVCDGVGGAQAGKTASSLAVEQVRDIFRSQSDLNLAHRLIMAADRASAAIFAASQEDPSTEGMATTLVAAAFDGEQCYIVNVGDSRAYRIKQGQIEKVTTDHTLIQDQIDNGLLTVDQAANSPFKHVITRSLGRQTENVGAQDYGPIALVPGEVYILCSDGLTDMVSEDEILAVAGSRRPASAAQELVDLANLHGGRDNITVIVVRVEGEYEQLASTMRLPTVEAATADSQAQLEETPEQLASTLRLPIIEAEDDEDAAIGGAESGPDAERS